jgi:hypothetical protein
MGNEKVLTVLTTASPDEMLRPGAELDAAALQMLARRAQGLAFVAFDGEGLLLWIFGEGPLPEWLDG